MNTDSEPSAAPVHKDRRFKDPGQTLDTEVSAAIAKAYSGLSPISLALARIDWGMNLLTSPGAQLRLGQEAARLWGEWITRSASDAALGVESQPVPSDPPADVRFAHPAWQQWPWSAAVSGFGLWEQWLLEATDLRGMREHSRRQMHFYTKKYLDAMSPANWLLTNPEAQQRALATGGKSLFKGMAHMLEDNAPSLGMPAAPADPGRLAPGNGLALTPGCVVLRNHMMELIQYTPATPSVFAEPVLIVPSCIMKYYILDLSPSNSLVGWLVAQGHTVFMMSWRNPDESDALIGIEDYVHEGVLCALRHVSSAFAEPVHLVGYCLGGTFAAIAAAALHGNAVRGRAARATDRATDLAAGHAAGHAASHNREVNPLASLTLLATETDFSEPGEIGVLIDEAQVHLLEEMMAERGFLTGQQMAQSFQFLHSRELVWAARTRRWMLGEDETSNDLMVWNADVTRLPAVMHSEYLRRCYLHNELPNGRFMLEGHRVALSDIRVATFAVGTVKDHVVPWHSAFKIHRQVGGAVRFVLTNGGHNAGIVSEPGHKGRSYQMLDMAADATPMAPEEWQQVAPRAEGSWWPAWSAWLFKQGSGRQVEARPPPQDPVLGAAPGAYVMVRYPD